MNQMDVKYTEEALELIKNMEETLLLMEARPEDDSLIQQVFRDMHTLKGNSAMLGFKLVADFTHHLESIYDYIRNKEIKLSKDIINITLNALDHLSLLVNSNHVLNASSKKSHEQITAVIIEIANCAAHNAGSVVSEISVATEMYIQEKELLNYHIVFTPHADILLNGTNPLYLIDDLYALGSCKAEAHVYNIPPLEKCEHNVCYTSWDIYLTTTANKQAILDVFEFVLHKCELKISLLKEPGIATVSDGAIVQERVDNDLLSTATAQVLESTPVAESTLSTKKNNIIPSIRVPSERLDIMMSLVSELMTLQAKLSTHTDQHPQSELLGVTENLEKISTRLRDNAFSMCLIPVENMITPFKRLVRDLSIELNKEIEFITEGTETELDKNIMEGLSDPLMHLLRNSIDHGIEYPDVRKKEGKPAIGKIILKAFCAGTNVYIEIQDDGKGMDPDKIRNKAIQKGIIASEDNLTEKEIFNLIFLPGFSTAEQVSELSGRGVGMDVVKRKIADIRGQIKITSKINAGTTITIKLPITVSIIDGLLVKINDADFVIPLSAVERCYELPVSKKLNRFHNLIVLDGEQIPFISLSQEFDGIESVKPAQEIVIVYYDEKRVGLIVDRIIGKFQAVLKPLGRYFLHMDNISGATILGDGKIALVLDTNNVTELFLNKKSLSTCQ